MLNVVYIDDEPDLCVLFTEAFSSEKWHIHTFVDATAASSSIPKLDADLVFLDYRMPKVNGDMISNLIDSKIPKILITGELSVKPEYSYYKILHKPYDHDEVRQILQKFYIKKMTEGKNN